MKKQFIIFTTFVSSLLLCSCKSLEKTVEISLGEGYYTGSFVRPTTPDKVKVYVANDPLPLTTEVIGKFSATDPKARRNESLDVLLDTVKKEVSDVGGNGLFLTDHYKPHWLGNPQHVMFGYILLQPDTIVRPDKEHPLNTAVREYTEQEEAKKLAEALERKKLFPPHNFYFSTGYYHVNYPREAAVSDIERNLNSGVGVQGSYTYKFFGLLYNGYFAKSNRSFHSAPPNETAYQMIMVKHSIIPIVTLCNMHKKKWYSTATLGIGYQWEDIYLREMLANGALSKSSGRRCVMHGAVGLEYRIHEHWGVEAQLHATHWGVNKKNGITDKSYTGTTETGISLGFNYYL